MTEVGLVPDEVRVAGGSHCQVTLLSHVFKCHTILPEFQKANSKIQFNRVVFDHSHADGVQNLFKHVDNNWFRHSTHLRNLLVVYTFDVSRRKYIFQLDFLGSVAGQAGRVVVFELESGRLHCVVIRHEADSIICLALVHSASKFLCILYVFSSSEVAQHRT